MLINKGTFGKDTVESNSLIVNLLKYPEISKVLIRRFPQYSLTFFTEGLGRYAKESLIGDKKFRWALLGRLSRPSTCTGTSTSNGIGFSAFTVELNENFLNPYDIIAFEDGTQAQVQGSPVQTLSGFLFTFKLVTEDITATLAAANIAQGKVIGKQGTAFPESSDRGYETNVFPDWFENYTTIERVAKSISGSALTDVTWIENNGQRLWYFTQQELVLQQFLYEQEVSRWYGRRTVDANGNPTLFDPSNKPIFKGDGLLPQIDPINLATYTGSLTDVILTNFMSNLFQQTGKPHAKWLVFTGTEGRKAFHEAMKELIIPPARGGGFTVAYDYDSGREIEIGVNFTTYHALGHNMTLVYNPIFDDPNVGSGALDPQTGKRRESFRMVFMDYDAQDGVANVEVKTKGAGGINRGFIIKYIPGMVNPFDQKSVIASNAKDAFVCEVMSESMVVVRNPFSCGQLIKV